jgi:hypothetical protein
MAGLTLGCRYGPLNGLYGLAADNLLGAEVVLADGRRVTIGPDEEPELFWAIRGSVVILDSTKSNAGDPIEVANASLTALSRQDVADRAIEFVARILILSDGLVCPSKSNRSTAGDAPRSRRASLAISEPQRRLAELMNRWWQARDSGNKLPSDEQAELETLAQAELRAADDSAGLFSDSDRSVS